MTGVVELAVSAWELESRTPLRVGARLAHGVDVKQRIGSCMAGFAASNVVVQTAMDKP